MAVVWSGKHLSTGHPFDRSIDWLIDWLIDEWIDWLIDWWMDGSIDWLIGWWVDWLIGYDFEAWVFLSFRLCTTASKWRLSSSPIEIWFRNYPWALSVCAKLIYTKFRRNRWRFGPTCRLRRESWRWVGCFINIKPITVSVPFWLCFYTI